MLFFGTLDIIGMRPMQRPQVSHCLALAFSDSLESNPTTAPRLDVHTIGLIVYVTTNEVVRINWSIFNYLQFSKSPTKSQLPIITVLKRLCIELIDFESNILYNQLS
jgi:hypothetical protein